LTLSFSEGAAPPPSSGEGEEQVETLPASRVAAGMLPALLL
jgi:hypothetical protein